MLENKISLIQLTSIDNGENHYFKDIANVAKFLKCPKRQVFMSLNPDLFGFRYSLSEHPIKGWRLKNVFVDLDSFVLCAGILGAIE